MPKGDYGWLTTSFDPNDLPEEMPAIAAPPVSGPPPLRVPLAETATPSPVDLAPVEVPAAVPAEPDAAASDAKPAPFWKKELSLGRGSKEPKAPKQPKAPKEPKAKKSKEDWDPAEQKTPFWKLELSRKPKEPKQAKEPKALKEPKEKTPFWKLELSRKPKEAKDPAAVEEPRRRRRRSGSSSRGQAEGREAGQGQEGACREEGEGPEDRHRRAEDRRLADRRGTRHQ